MVYIHNYWFECPGPASYFHKESVMRADVIACEGNEICRQGCVSTDLDSHITGYSRSS